MAAPTLTVKKTTHAPGLNVTTNTSAATGGGDSFANSGVEMLYINNASASPVTLTFPITLLVDGQTPPAKTVTVAANTIMLVGAFPTGIYNDASGNLNWTYSAATSVTVAAIAQST